MAEPTIICPQCKTEIKLTESLAAPLLADVKRQFEQRLAQKDTDMAKREQSLNERAESIEKAKANLDQQIAAKLQQERVRIAAEEQQKAKQLLGNDLNQKVKEIGTLQEVLKQRDAKLAEAQTGPGGTDRQAARIGRRQARNGLDHRQARPGRSRQRARQSQEGSRR